MIKIIKNYLRKFKFFRLINYKINNNYKNFRNLGLSQESQVIDIGANIGLISQVFVDLYNCNIESYEPNKFAFKVLKKRFLNNKKVKCYKLAVTEDGSKKKIFFHQKSKINPTKYSTATSLLPKKENINNKDFCLIKTISISSIMAKFKYIDLIKIDVEGYEYKILPYIIKNKRNIEKVICELHGNPKLNKNFFLKKNYFKLIKKLKKNKLYNSWLLEHF
jgi:FkbM family methyltransferase